MATPGLPPHQATTGGCTAESVIEQLQKVL
jgi:hypothetical protein